MAKKKVIDSVFLEKYQDISIEYPFCYKTENKYESNYFRYLEDGRYEYICISEKKMHMSYGTRVDSIQGLMNDDNFYFKVLANREKVITNKDFENARIEYYLKYKEYLNGDKFLAREVEKILSMKQPDKKEEKVFTEGDIIINNEGEETPF